MNDIPEAPEKVVKRRLCREVPVAEVENDDDLQEGFPLLLATYVRYVALFQVGKTRTMLVFILVVTLG